MDTSEPDDIPFPYEGEKHMGQAYLERITNLIRQFFDNEDKAKESFKIGILLGFFVSFLFMLGLMIFLNF